MSSQAGWVKALTLLALGRVPKPSVEELKALAELLHQATTDIPDGVVHETLVQLTLHLAGDFLPSPAVILAAVRERTHPLNLPRLFLTIRRAYFRAQLHLSPATLAQLFPDAYDYAAARALLDTVGPETLLDHALSGAMHPLDLKRATEAAEVAVSKLPLAGESLSKLPAGQKALTP